MYRDGRFTGDVVCFCGCCWYLGEGEGEDAGDDDAYKEVLGKELDEEQEEQVEGAGGGSGGGSGGCSSDEEEGGGGGR